MHCLMGKYNFLGHCASQDIVITWLGHYVKLFSKPSAVPWALATRLVLVFLVETGF